MGFVGKHMRKFTCHPRNYQWIGQYRDLEHTPYSHVLEMKEESLHCKGEHPTIKVIYFIDFIKFRETDEIYLNVKQDIPGPGQY